MKIETIRTHIEITTSEGEIFRIRDGANFLEITCVTARIDTNKTHGNKIEIIANDLKI